MCIPLYWIQKINNENHFTILNYDIFIFWPLYVVCFVDEYFVNYKLYINMYVNYFTISIIQII